MNENTLTIGQTNAIGHEITPPIRLKGHHECLAMGLTDSALAWKCVNSVSEKLEADQLRKAIGCAMEFFDMSDAYRLMAVLLTGATPDRPATAPPQAPKPRKARTVSRTPNARIISVGADHTEWHIELPAPRGSSKLYRAITRTNSDAITVQSAARCRSIPPVASRRLLPLIRSAIRSAEAAAAVEDQA